MTDRAQARELLHHLAVELRCESTSLNAIFRRMVFDGGIDFTGIGIDDLECAWQTPEQARWPDIGWSLSELLAFYCAVGEEMTDLQVLCWVTATILMADAIALGHRDWEIELDKVLSVLGRMRRLDRWNVSRLELIHLLFCRPRPEGCSKASPEPE